jgi:oxazoline/thiazoline synthase
VLTRPLLRPGLRPLVVDADTLVLAGEREHVRLSGGAVAEVLPLLDGTRGPAELVAALDERAPHEVYYTLLELERRGYLVEADGSPPERLALLTGLGVAPQKLLGARARTAAIGDVDVGPLFDALAELGVAADDEAPLAVVLSDDYLREGLGDENRAALASSRPWLVAKPMGGVLWLGPLFVPGQTGCWECLAHRLRGHRPAAQLATAWEPAVSTVASPAGSAATQGVAAGLIAGEVAKELAGVGSALRGRLLTLDLATLSLAEHALPHRPQCPACGDPALLNSSAARVTLRPLRAAVGAAGERVREPAETLRSLSALVSPITGVVRSVERLEVHAPLHLYRAGPVPALTPTSLGQLEAALRTVSGGKGPTDAQARASALCEGIERYCAHAVETRQAIESPYLDVADRAVHPDDLLLFSESQRRERDERNADAEDARFRVPEPFDATKAVAWTQAWSISGDEPRLLPTAYCYISYSLPAGHHFCWGDSNGCAAGNEPEEAILQGLLEVVERDAVALWWYTRARRPAVDFSSSRSAYVSDVIDAYAAQGRDVWALDLTNDLGIPAVVALSCRAEDRNGVTFGFGAHLDAEIAVGRALSELVQMTFGVQAKVRRSPMLERWLADVTPTNEPWLAGEGQTALAPSSVSGDLAADIRACTEAIARAGHETLVVDLTLPDVGLPVVKVVAPGLRHFWPRFAPGRLYDVPVALGWLEQRPAERDLNPYPVVW